MVEHVLEVTSPLSASIAPQRQVGAIIVSIVTIVIDTIVIFVINFTTTISLSILPSSSSSRWHQVTDSGRTAMFNCSVSGFPVLNVYW